MWVRAREIGNKKKKEERRRQSVGFVQDVPPSPTPPPPKKSNHLEEKLSVFASVGPTNFDIFTIGRKKKKKSFFNLVPL